MTTVADLKGIAGTAAQRAGVPVDLFVSQIMQESSFNPNAVNGGAVGIAQFIPATAAQYGVTNPFDPSMALTGAAAYDADLHARTGSWVKTLQAYGTLPSDLSNLSAGQQTVLQTAARLDGADPTQVANAPGAAPTSPITPLPGVTPVGFTIPGTSITIPSVSDVASYLVRGSLIFLGILLIVSAVWLLGKDAVEHGASS